ncbi:beta-hexosaminidase [Vallitalea longa]|uniref:beta-N-acetylhexosaminidase n=1 Tax=Vallitalea longa TaxID=2936439 RepID=A0A9W5YCI0_9FIRM|nr:glycoside hydrolase family 3 N-terminal domain-containing protein [Vallitalea longa]GKX31495.1 beta-hexosaminidase [Vallitalea longa]
MIQAIDDNLQSKIDTLFDNMSLEEKVSQVQCVNVGHLSDDKIIDLIRNEKIGSMFVGNITLERSKRILDLTIQYNTGIPVIINADLVNGAGSRLHGGVTFPHQMGCAATDSEDLMESMGEITAREGRANGVHWTFAPVMDPCINLNNPMMHIRTSGDKPEHIMKMNSAFIKGVQKSGMMAATAKHFPGDGLDGRDTHITTLINDLSREEWEKTYGKIWRNIIDSGVLTVMCGHIALPFIDPEYEDESKRYKGPRPATLSKKIQLDFLRGELGFDGAIVSDAINMIGFGAHIPREEYGWRLIDEGSDMLLWTIPDFDSPRIIEAINDGRLSKERLDDAVRRILELKARVGLLNEKQEYPIITEKDREEYEKVSQKMADHSITIVRDTYESIPMKNLKDGAKVLTITAHYIEGQRKKSDKDDLEYIDQELEKRGFKVDHLINPNGIAEIQKIVDDYDAIFVNIKYPPRYGSIRLYGNSIELFKGSWWVDNKKVVFTSFGDPYKLYDLPSLHNYINVYSNYEVSQRAAVKVWLGEIEAVGKSPIELEGLIKREV